MVNRLFLVLMLYAGNMVNFHLGRGNLQMNREVEDHAQRKQMKIMLAL